MGINAGDVTRAIGVTQRLCDVLSAVLERLGSKPLESYMMPESGSSLRRSVTLFNIIYIMRSWVWVRITS